MRIIAISKEQLPYFKALDIFGLLDREEQRPDILLGLIHEDADGSRPAGLLFGDLLKQKMVLRWLFVDPPLRGRSYGEQLLFCFLRYAEEKGVKETSVIFPQEYGYEAVCRNDRIFFQNHGFRSARGGGMTISVKEFQGLREESNPLSLDDTEMLERLLSDPEDEEEPASPYDDRDFLKKIHKPWQVKETDIREFSRLPNLQGLIKGTLAGTKALDVRCIGELSFEQFREGIRLCEERGNTGFLTSLTGIPVDYFDLDISSCILTDGQVTGLDLLHYNKMEKTLIGEVYVSTVEDNLQSLVEMLRFSVIAMNKKYPQDTRFVIPYETEQHMLLVGRLFGEREQR